MTFEEAKRFLNGCTREELRDHAFGDAEVFWMQDGVEVASGHFGGTHQSVSSNAPDEEYRPLWGFSGREALELRKCGKLTDVSRNDSTGPDQYQEGQCLPGLTREGVLKELTTPPSWFSEK